MMRRVSFAAAFLSISISLHADPLSDVQRHAEMFRDAFIGGNVDAVLDLYSDDATVIWPGYGQEASGKEAIRELVVQAMQELPPDSWYTICALEAVSLGEGYLATVGRWEHSFTADNGVRQSTEVRTMEIIMEERGRTYYVFDHASIGVPQTFRHPPSIEEAHTKGCQ